MLTWVIFIYVGFLTWLALLIYLPLKKKISAKQGLIYFSIFLLGTVAAYYTYEYDLLNSGIKYVD